MHGELILLVSLLGNWGNMLLGPVVDSLAHLKQTRDSTRLDE
jgi:hypothetical protein